MNFNKKLGVNPNRRELFNYIFDILEYLDLVKWTVTNGVIL